MRFRTLALALIAPILVVGALAIVLSGEADGPKAGKVRTSQEVEPEAAAPSGTAEPSARPKLVRVGTFDLPLYVTAPPGDRKRVFVVEQNGRIRLLLRGKRVRRPFLDLSGRVSKGGERGLLSMAFTPDYATSRRFYVNFTDRKGNTRVQEFKRSKRSPNVASKKSRRSVLFVDQPFENHNGGLLLFGPDGLLYIGLGDGGSEGDPGNRAQGLSSLLGKLLRIDPRRTGSRRYRIPSSNPFVGKGGRDEIYAYGLRNPWRFSFDSKTGDLYIGDVGQDAIEEVDFAGPGAAKGRNYGWSCFEGRSRFDSSRSCPNAVEPVFQYPLTRGRCSVTGGVVARDPALGSLRGRYIYGDFCRGQVRSLKVSGGRATDDRSLGVGTVPSLSSFGEDARKRVYVTSLEGPVYRLKSR